MKTYNYKSWVQNPRYQKWGLFCLLAVSLGFNLSMNPEHFNNIARHEKPEAYQSIDLAATEAPAVTVDQAKAKEVYFSGKDNKNYRATVYEVKIGDNSSTMATVELLCTECPKKLLTMGLSSGIGNLNDWMNELKAKVGGETAAGTTATGDVKTSPQKPGDATEVDLAEWAKKCEKSSDSQLLTCHKNRLIELSKFLKNSADQDTLVNQYFRDNLYTDIKQGFTSSTVREVMADRCEGSIVYTSSFYRVGCSTSEKLAQSNEIAKDLIGKLRSSNGKSVIETLIKLDAQSYTAQLRSSQTIAIQGLKEGNTLKRDAGLAGMNSDMLMANLSQNYQDLLDQVNGRADKSLKQNFLTSLDNGLYNPIANIMGNMSRFVLNGDPANPNKNAPHLLTDFQIPNLGEGLTMPSMPGTPGLPGNIPTGSATARRGDRGGSFGNLGSIITPTFNNQPSPLQPGLPVQPTGRVSGRNGATW